MALWHQSAPWRYLALGSLLFFMPLLLLVAPWGAASTPWQTAGLAGQSVRHVATGFADGLFFYYAWTPSEGLLQASASAPNQNIERSVWRPIDGALPGRGVWGAPEVRRLVVDSHNGRHVLITLAAGNQSGLYGSNDGGASWQLMRSFAGSQQNPVVALGPLGAMYLADNQRLLLNLGGGSLWQQTPTWREALGTATAILASEGRSADAIEQTQPQLLLGTTAGYILRLPSALADHWEESRLLTQGAVTLLAEASAHPDALYAWGERTLFASADAGVSWTAVFQAAAGDEAQALAVAADDPLTIYLALTRTGVMVSHDGGQAWQLVNGGLRHGDVHALTVDRRSGGYLLAATDQGLWRFPLLPAAR